MAIGDGTDAALGGMDLVPGSLPAAQLDTQDNKTRDYVANGSSFWKPGVTLPLNRGGHGSTTAAGARSALSCVEQSGGTIRLRWDQPTLNWVPAINGVETSPLVRHDQMNSAISSAVGGVDLSSRVAKSGDTMTGNLFLPNSTAATSGYTIAYINSDGRVSRGASTERVKKYITQIDPAVLGSVFPDLFRFQMRQGDGSWRFGYIAERLAESEALRPFVVWEMGDDGQLVLDENDNPIPISIDFIGLFIVQIAQLHTRVSELEAQHAGTD